MRAIRNCLALVLAAACLATIPAAAQNTAASNAATAPSTKKYDAVYIVIKADLKQDLLLGIEEQLKPWGVTFKVNDVTYKDDLITGITIAVAVPDYSGTLTVGNKQQPITEPLIFYSEPGKNGLTTKTPTDLSRRGNLVVKNNLHGMLVLYNGDSLQSAGYVSTTWK
jgi:hypothetical protein